MNEQYRRKVILNFTHLNVHGFFTIRITAPRTASNPLHNGKLEKAYFGGQAHTPIPGKEAEY